MSITCLCRVDFLSVTTLYLTLLQNKTAEKKSKVDQITKQYKKIIEKNY